LPYQASAKYGNKKDKWGMYMKKMIILLLLLGIKSAGGTYVTGVPSSTSRITHQQYAFNTNHENFGKTHFIVGYESKKKEENKEVEPLFTPGTEYNHVATNAFTKTLFTSVHDVRKELNELLCGAKKSICIATFTLTDTKIAEQLIRAHEAGVKVTVLTDKEKMRERYSKINILIRHNIPVHFYNNELNPNQKQKKAKDGLMHHKFMIIDDEILIFGSLNLTKAAQEDNIENITITTEPQMIADYFDEFKRLLLISTKVIPAHLFE
jgi:mitochondrial cardiolipin hydrolase